MVHRLALRVLAASVAVLAFIPGLPAAKAHADPVMVFPGMEILQDNRLCTLGYVDPAQKIAYTAGHCRSGRELVTDKNRNVIGHLATFRDDTPSGSTVATDQVISDYEAIALDGNVPTNNMLPGGRALVSSPNMRAAARAGDLPFRRGHRRDLRDRGKRQQRLVHHVPRRPEPPGRFGRTRCTWPLPGAPGRSSGSSTASGATFPRRCRGGPPPSRSARISGHANAALARRRSARRRARTPGSTERRHATAHRWIPVSTRRHSP